MQNSDSSKLSDSSMVQENISLEAREELLEDYDYLRKSEENIELSTLVWTYILLFLFLLIVLPKIYIANQIYYLSKDINKKYHKYTALKEENRFLKKNIEKLHYQNQIVDPYDLP